LFCIGGEKHEEENMTEMTIASIREIELLAGRDSRSPMKRRHYAHDVQQVNDMENIMYSSILHHAKW
jgi:hypothetical protein